MAVTITVPQVAIAIRAAAQIDTVPPEVTLVLGFLVPAASAIILDYAPGAPDEVHDAALIRLTGWLYDADPTDSRVSRALEVSGGAGLLARWRVHRAGIIQSGASGDTPTPAPVPVPGGGIPAPPGSGHYILTADNGELEWVQFPAP